MTALPGGRGAWPGTGDQTGERADPSGGPGDKVRAVQGARTHPDEWLVGRRCLSEHSIRLVLSERPGAEEVSRPEIKEEVIELNAA
jgi:hypothetical protein